MMHQLEAWITKRTTSVDQTEHSKIVRGFLSGSDAKSYEQVLPDIVGAWDHLLFRVTSRHDLTLTNSQNDVDLWDAHCAIWPFLWQHLTETARSLSITVWNEDETGARFFSEALVRWPENLVHQFSDRAHLRNPRLIYPTLFRMGWSDAKSHIATNIYNLPTSPSPSQLFSTISRLAHNDVLLLTAALVLYWTIAEKQASDIGARTARALLRGEGGNSDGLSPDAQDPRFHSLCLDFLRMAMAREGAFNDSYAREIDGLVDKLDNMTEEPKVPGRAYIPTTLHGRYELNLSMVAIMLATTPDNEDDILLEAISDLALQESLLPEGDESLRRLLHELDQWEAILKEASQPLIRGASLLFPEQYRPRALTMLTAITTSVKSAIQAERKARLSVRPVDKERLNMIRRTIENALLTNPPEISFFTNIELGSVPSNGDVELCSVSIGGIHKGELTNPPMGSALANLDDILVSHSKRTVSNNVMRAFKNQKRIHCSLNAEVNNTAFWQSVSNLVHEVGPNPVLLVSRPSEARVLRRFVYSVAENTENMIIDTNPPIDRSNSFIATVNGIHVYGADLDVGRAWLFSSNLLRAVRYSELEQNGRCVEIDHEIDDDMLVTLTIRVRQLLEWMDWPIFQFEAVDSE